MVKLLLSAIAIVVRNAGARMSAVRRNQKQGYKEAKVGVIFWSKDHQKVKRQRGKIRHREYIATLKSRKEFRAREVQLKAS